MEPEEQQIMRAVLGTEIVRLPNQRLATFGTTNIHYYLVTEPAYAEPGQSEESVVREGKVVAERPRIVTPYYLTRLDGFGSDARKYFEMLRSEAGPDTAGIIYSYRNELEQTSIVTEKPVNVVSRLADEIDRRQDPLTTLLRGMDALWDVSLLKFIHELTRQSVSGNLQEMRQHGLLQMDRSGPPQEARWHINSLFAQVSRGERDASELKAELDRWNVFEEYEDRFLSIFKRRR
jgi:hypothetical protein